VFIAPFPKRIVFPLFLMRRDRARPVFHPFQTPRGYYNKNTQQASGRVSGSCEMLFQYMCTTRNELVLFSSMLWFCPLCVPGGFSNTKPVNGALLFSVLLLYKAPIKPQQVPAHLISSHLRFFIPQRAKLSFTDAVNLRLIILVFWVF
jgi:hypothetical protein